MKRRLFWSAQFKEEYISSAVIFHAPYSINLEGFEEADTYLIKPCGNMKHSPKDVMSLYKILSLYIRNMNKTV